LKLIFNKTAIIASGITSKGNGTPNSNTEIPKKKDENHTIVNRLLGHQVPSACCVRGGVIPKRRETRVNRVPHTRHPTTFFRPLPTASSPTRLIPTHTDGRDNTDRVSERAENRNTGTVGPKVVPNTPLLTTTYRVAHTRFVSVPDQLTTQKKGPGMSEGGHHSLLLGSLRNRLKREDPHQPDDEGYGRTRSHRASEREPTKLSPLERGTNTTLLTTTT